MSTTLMEYLKPEATAVLIYQLWQKRRAVLTAVLITRPTKQTRGVHKEAREAPGSTPKHACADTTIPSHLKLVHKSEHTQWVQVVDMSLVICDSILHLVVMRSIPSTHLRPNAPKLMDEQLKNRIYTVRSTTFLRSRS